MNPIALLNRRDAPPGFTPATAEDRHKNAMLPPNSCWRHITAPDGMQKCWYTNADAWGMYEAENDPPGAGKLPGIFDPNAGSFRRPGRAEAWSMYWLRAAFGVQFPEHWPACLGWTQAELRRVRQGDAKKVDGVAEGFVEPAEVPATPPDPEGFARDIRRDAPQLRDLVPDPLLDRVRSDLIAEIVKGLDERFLRFGMRFTVGDLRQALANILDTRAAIDAFGRLRGETIHGDRATSIVGAESPINPPAKTREERLRSILWLVRYGNMPYDTIKDWTDAQLDEMGGIVTDLMDEEDDDEEATERFDASQPPEVVTFTPNPRTSDGPFNVDGWQEHLERAAAEQSKPAEQRTILAPAAGAMSGKTGQAWVAGGDPKVIDSLGLPQPTPWERVMRLADEVSISKGQDPGYALQLADAVGSLVQPDGVDYATGPDRTAVSEVMLVDGKPQVIREAIMDEAATETVLGDSKPTGHVVKLKREARIDLRERDPDLLVAAFNRDTERVKQLQRDAKAEIAAWVNDKPAELPLRVRVGDRVKLRNADNTGVTCWRWSLQAKPDGSQVSVGPTGLGPSIMFTADVPGTWIVELMVNSGHGKQRTCVAVATFDGPSPSEAQEIVEVPLTLKGGATEGTFEGETVVDGVVTRVLSLRQSTRPDVALPGGLALTMEPSEKTMTRVKLLLLGPGSKAAIGGWTHLGGWYYRGQQHEAFYLVLHEPRPS